MRSVKIFAETDRLILRELLETDVDGMFELDSDPEVHRYLGNNPVTTKEEIKSVIQFVRKQYVDNGIGRWAIIEKSSGDFVGWAGLKFITETINNHTNFYDVGYRLKKKHWGKGYATETAKISIEYCFTTMNKNEIIGITHVDNQKSRHALEKAGLRFIEKFEHKDMTCNWFKITKDEWLKKNNTKW